MNKNILINILRILFVFVIVFLAVFACINPAKTQTNILDAILSDKSDDRLLVDLSQRHSGHFNVIFESENIDAIENAKKSFEQSLDKKDFQADFSQNNDMRDILATYSYYSQNLLGKNTQYKLRHYDYEIVKLEAIERLYNPIGINLLPIEEDPFLLFSDFLLSLSNGNNTGIIEKNERYYEIISLKLKDEIALSPSLLNKEMSEIVKIKDSIETNHKDVTIYLTGIPVHTYYASSKSMTEINIICVLSSLFIILLCRFYFRSFKILLPVAVSIALGILSGYLVTSVFFHSIHILTFVFSTTLIGICVDYSLHFFAHNSDINSILKSLTISMLTTVCAFLILLFSGIVLLQQIAVFTATGLLSVYLFVVLFYPCLPQKFKCDFVAAFSLSEILDFHITDKKKIFVLLICIAAGAAGLFRLHFNDDITGMYRPTQSLLKAEQLYTELTQKKQNTSFLIVQGNDIQNLLENEECATKDLKQEQYIALSKFLPSIKQQKENKLLREKLYKSQLNDYATFLSPNIKIKLLNEQPRLGFLNIHKLKMPYLQEFFAGENISVVILQDIENSTIEKILSENSNVKYVNLKDDISNKVAECRKSCISLLLPIAAILFVLLSIIYKPKNALKILAPSFIGCVFTIGLIGIFQHSINLFHILSIFLITGFSLDYSIFRYESTKENSSSNTAVFISCTTSVFSFLLLSFTSFKLISSLGLVLALGLSSSYVFSLILLSGKGKSDENFEQENPEMH